MTEIYYYFIAFCAGLALGAFFCLHLWASVKRLVNVHTPWYALFGNFFLRISVVTVGFYLVMNGRWDRLVAALLGFIVVREFASRLLVRKIAADKGMAWRS